MAKVLLFQCGNEMEIRQALTPMKISVASVPAEHFYLTLGELEKALQVPVHIVKSDGQSLFDEMNG